VRREIADAEEVLRDSAGDAEMHELAAAELEGLRQRETQLLDEIKVLLLPSDPNDEKDVILEVRAGTGGDEAGLFAGDLLRMYIRFAERRHWKAELMSSTESPAGGYKEAVLSIQGAGAFTCPCYGVERPHTHFRCHSGRAAGSRRGGGGDRPQRPGDRHIPRVERGWPARGAHRHRTAKRRCGCSGPTCTSANRGSRRRLRRPHAGSRWGRETAARRFARTTSRRDASPIRLSGRGYAGDDRGISPA